MKRQRQTFQSLLRVTGDLEMGEFTRELISREKECSQFLREWRAAWSNFWLIDRMEGETEMIIESDSTDRT